MSKSKKTLEEVKSSFRENGVTMTQWSRDHGFPRDLVYAVVAGRIRGWRGESHRIATALGLKTPRTNEMASASQPADSGATADARAARPNRHLAKTRGKQSGAGSIKGDAACSDAALNRPAHPFTPERQGDEP